MEDLGFEIRKQVARYLAGDIGLAQFHASAMPLTWDIERRSDPSTAILGREIELLLAEAAHGDWDEHELRERLAPMVTNYVVTLGSAPASGSVNTVTTTQLIVAEPAPSLVQT